MRRRGEWLSRQWHDILYCTIDSGKMNRIINLSVPEGFSATSGNKIASVRTGSSIKVSSDYQQVRTNNLIYQQSTNNLFVHTNKYDKVFRNSKFATTYKPSPYLLSIVGQIASVGRAKYEHMDKERVTPRKKHRHTNNKSS